VKWVSQDSRERGKLLSTLKPNDNTAHFLTAISQHAMMRAMPRFALICMLVALFLSNSVACGGGDLQRYPGNGIPHVSKNVEIKDLQDEIIEYSKGFSSINHQNGRIIFHNANKFKFVSDKKLSGEKPGDVRFSVQIYVKIEKGNLTLEIGDVRYRVTGHSVVVENNGKLIYSNDAVQVRSIIMEKFSEKTVSTRLETDKTLLGVWNVAVSTPATIGIQIDGDGSGYLGPWVWIRGYE